MPEFTGRLRTPRLAAAPSSPVVGEMYFDTALAKLYWWNGTIWVAASGSAEIYEQPAAPSAPGIGAIWIDTDDVPPAWASLVPLVTNLPSNPADGQEVYYVADATNGVMWHLRYRSASTSLYKWEFVGGSVLRAQDDSFITVSGTTYAEGSPNVRVTCPLIGDYDVNFGHRPWSNTGTATGISAALQVAGVVPPNDNEVISSVHTVANQQYYNQARQRRVTVLAANDTLRLVNKISGAAATVANRWLTAQPVRVG